MSKRTKWIIAAVATVVLIAGIVTGAVLIHKNKNSGNQPTPPANTVFHEVKFGLASTTAPKDAGTVTLPQTAMVQDGTIVGALEMPYKEGGVFVGWYYDSDRTKMALSGDTITADTTLYADFENGDGLENNFKINYMSAQDVGTDYEIILASYGLSAAEVRNFLTVCDLSKGSEKTDYKISEIKDANRIINLDAETIQKMRPKRDEIDGTEAPDLTQLRFFSVKPVSAWQQGDLFQAELLSTEALRFVSGDTVAGENVVYNNFTVARTEINTLRVNKDVLFINVADTKGVDVKGGLYNLVADLNGDDAKQQETSGIMQYSGDLSAGMTVAVYDGTLKDDGTVDGEVIYLLITEKKEDGSYAYEGAELASVLFIPDVIPVPDDGTFDDGTFTIDKAYFDFESENFRMFGLDENSAVEAGDFIAFYKGRFDLIDNDALVGYGLVKSVTESGKNVTVVYEEASAEDILNSFQLYSAESNMDVPLSDEDIAALEKSFAEEAAKNGFGDRTVDYIEKLLAGDELEAEQYAEAVSSLQFNDLTGHSYSLEDIRLFADKADKVEISEAPKIQALVGTKLDHFEGSTGVRIEISASFSIKFKLNKTAKGQNEIEIKIVAALEQEVVLGLSISADADWKWYVCIPVLQGVDIKVALQAGTYTGLGASVAVTTSVDDDESEWKKLVEANNSVDKKSGEKKDQKSLKETLKAMKNTFKTVQNGVGGSKEGKDKLEEVKDKDDDQFESNGGIGGDLQDKYSGMLSNDAEYIDIVNQKIFEIAASPDPIHLVEFSLGVNFVVSLKVNCMMGWGISYANAKQYCFLVHINVFGDEDSSCKSTTADLETPNFRADFYCFGNVGLRAGIRMDARVGVVSTKLNSVGIVAEVGIYGEVYGFLYVYYSWESGEGSDMGAMGSLLFEIGVYLKIDFNARIAGTNLNKTINIYSHQWPLLQLGAVKVPLEFEDIDDSAKNLEFKQPSESDAAAGKAVTASNTLKVPDDVFKIKVMSLKDGKTSTVNDDTAKAGDEAYTFSQNGIEFTQYNEEHYDIRCVDLTEKDGKAADTHQVRYLPETNEIYIRPLPGVSELWGRIIITYKNNSFGFNTNRISRTLNVHWKGSSVSAEVQYYIRDEKGTYQHFRGNYSLKQVGSFSGFDGILYDLVVDPAFCNQFPGYRLTDVRFDDEKLLEETYYAMNNSYNNLYAEYKKMVNTSSGSEVRKKYEEVRRAADEVKAAWDAYNNFGRNIDQVLEKQEGTMYFLMCSKDTVVRLFFDPVENTVDWVMNPRGFDAMDAGQPVYVYTADCYNSTKVQKDSKLFDSLPDNFSGFVKEHANHKINWYYFEPEKAQYSFISKEALDNRDKWQPLTEETVMPDKYIMVVGVEEDADVFTVFWYDDKNEIYDHMNVRAGDIIPDHDGIPADRLEGKLFSGWVLEDGKTIIPGYTDKMPRANVSIYPTFVETYRTLKYTVEGKDGYTDSSFFVAAYGSSMLDALNSFKEWPVYEGFVLNWYIDTGSDNPEDREIRIVPSLTMPDADLNIIGRYEIPTFTLTWKDGANERNETYKLGDGVMIPADTAAGESGIGWKFGDEFVKGTFVMPDHDVTLVAETHTHNFTLTHEDAATCIATGTKHYECELCGALKNETTAKNPANHAAGEPRIENAVNATHLAEGYSGDRYCRHCGTLLEKGSVIPKLELGNNYIITYRDDRGAADYEAVYEYGKTAKLDMELFAYEGMRIDQWNCRIDGERHAFARDASIVWEAAAAVDADYIYLPALDPDGDHIVTINAVHALLFYEVEYYSVTSDGSVIRILNGGPASVTYGTEPNISMDWDAIAYDVGFLGKNIIGWSYTQNGGIDLVGAEAKLPLMKNLPGGGEVLKLYAVWSE